MIRYDRLRRLARRWRFAAAAIAAGAVLAVVAVVAVVVRDGGDGRPEAVVRDYLAAIRAGEVAEALRIAGEPEPEPSGEFDDTFLTAAALSADWQVTQVVRRYPDLDDQPVIVDVTVRAPDGATGQGRFRVAGESGAWSIENPFGSIPQHWVVRMGFVELNGVVQPIDPEARPTSYRLFPGAYRMYDSLAGLITDPPTVVVLPGASAFGLMSLHQPLFQPTTAANVAAQQAVATHIDGCVARPERAPAGCPFGASDLYVQTADGRYRDLADLAWEVVSYPEVLVVPSMDRVVGRHEGTVQLTGTGVPSGGDDDERGAFATECRIDLQTLQIQLSPGGEFQVSGDRLGVSTCR